MYKLIIGCSASFAVALLCACTTAPGLGEEAGGTRLPSGLTMLEADDELCEGTVQVEEDSVSSDGLQELFIEPGQNASFRLEDDEIEWLCTVGAAADVEEFDCPDEATHVRITRAGSGGEVLFECFG